MEETVLDIRRVEHLTQGKSRYFVIDLTLVCFNQLRVTLDVCVTFSVRTSVAYTTANSAFCYRKRDL
jgi:hypothetical protein